MVQHASNQSFRKQENGQKEIIFFKKTNDSFSKLKEDMTILA